MKSLLLTMLVTLVILVVLAVTAHYSSVEWATLVGVSIIIARDIMVDAR